MSKSYQKRAIRACKQVAYKYRNYDPDNYNAELSQDTFFTRDSCALCKIYLLQGSFCAAIPCSGCPLANIRQIDCGGARFLTYKEAIRAYHFSKRFYSSPMVYTSAQVREAFLRRAEFFDRIIPILKDIPSYKFTPSKWEYFKELNRQW